MVVEVEVVVTIVLGWDQGVWEDRVARTADVFVATAEVVVGEGGVVGCLTN